MLRHLEGILTKSSCHFMVALYHPIPTKLILHPCCPPTCAVHLASGNLAGFFDANAIAILNAAGVTGATVVSSGPVGPIITYEDDDSDKKKRLAIGLGVGLGVGIPVLIAIIVVIIIMRRRKQAVAPPA